MKKSIGLTADISTFNTNLPQTRHLNYFMGTNPRRYANGGDVNQGIPNYPNPNVTSGFLPMALGFAPGGEADSYFSKLYKAAVKVVAGYLGKSEDDEQVKEVAKKFIETDNGKAIAKQLLTQDEAYKIPEDNKTPVPVNPMPNTPPPGLTPKETVTTTPSDRQGSFDNIPLQPEPQITPPNDGGITTIEPEKAGMLDLNGDGIVDMKDLDFAIQNGLGWAIPMLKKILGIVEDWNPDEPEKTVPETPEKIVPETPEKIVPETPEKIVPETKIPPGGYPGAPSKESQQTPGIGPRLDTSPGQSSGAPQDTGGITKITKEDQDTLKKGADLAGGGGGGIKNAKDKKDVPSWALPMMSAGFAMMASKSPYFLQALGEGGQKGLETYSGIKEAESKKELDKAQIAGLEARAAYDRGEGRNTNKPTIINDSKGRRVYAIFDREKNQYVPIKSASGGPQYAVRSMIEIDEYLSGIHLNWSTMTEIEKQELRDAQIALDMGIAKTNVTSSVTEENNEPGFLGKIIKGVKEGITTAKDGGIVSLRR